jgi:hypothetical protein
MSAKINAIVYDEKIELVFCDKCAIRIAQRLIEQYVINHN